jgi:multicomponent Na+:H+ antiporter subunit D
MTAQLAPLAVAVPLIAAAAIAIGGKHFTRTLLASIGVGSIICSTVACLLLAREAVLHGTVVHWFGGWTPRHGVALGVAFVVDPAGGALAAFAASLTTAALLYAWTYYEQGDGSFGALMLVFGAALIGFFLTGDLFNLFVFFELMSVSAYALTAFRTEDTSAVSGAFAFAVVNSTAAFFTLAGIALVYARTGALAMAQIAQALGHSADPLVGVAFALIIIGFLTKAAVVPMHFWLSDAHAVAPTPLCALFSGIMVEAGLYAVARCYWSVFGGALASHADVIRLILLTAGITTAIVGAVMCYAQRHLKRLLAFSTISHSGIMLCGVACLAPTGLGGMFIYVVAHGFIKGALFMTSGIVLNRYGTVDVEQLRGKIRDVPWLPLLFVFGGLGLAGAPPFGTFVGKALMDRALDGFNAGITGNVLLCAAALTGGSLLNAAGRMTFGWGPAPDARAVTPKTEQPEMQPARGLRLVSMAIPTFALIVCAFGLGMIGAAPFGVAVAERFVDLPAQEAIVLNMVHGAGLATISPLSLKAGLIQGVTSALLAVGIAALGLFGYRVPWAGSRAARAYVNVMRIPHAWHSGIVTDYVAWLIVGGAVISGSFLLLVAK